MTSLTSSVGAVAWRALPTAVLLAACVTDVRARRIPNVLVLALLGGALVRASLAAWTGTLVPGLTAGPGDALLGAACGLALWLPFYIAGAFGAGDVKLFAAAAAWLGPAAVPTAALYAALAGGVLGMAWLAARHLTPVLVRVRPTAAAQPRIPYGLAIAAGVLGVLWRVP